MGKLYLETGQCYIVMSISSGKWPWSHHNFVSGPLMTLIIYLFCHKHKSNIIKVFIEIIYKFWIKARCNIWKGFYFFNLFIVTGG